MKDILREHDRPERQNVSKHNWFSITLHLSYPNWFVNKVKYFEKPKHLREKIK